MKLNVTGQAYQTRRVPNNRVVTFAEGVAVDVKGQPPAVEKYEEYRQMMKLWEAVLAQRSVCERLVTETGQRKRQKTPAGG